MSYLCRPIMERIIIMLFLIMAKWLLKAEVLKVLENKDLV